MTRAVTAPTVVKAHQADCGDSQPTTYQAVRADVYEEGALIFPCVKVQSDYRTSTTSSACAECRIRVPDQWWGDYLALVGAARIGEREMVEFGRGGRAGTPRQLPEQWFDYSERQMIAAI